MRRKYERGRVLNQVWSFGGIERSSKKSFVIPLVEPYSNKRDTQTLIPIILKYIHPRSIIYSDAWKAYSALKDHDYTHFIINHSDNFVDQSNRNSLYIHKT